MKLQIIYLTICSLTQAAYISRMALINHNQSFNPNRLRTSVFRPGVMMRPWNPRLVQASSHRVPYVVYRNPQRYSIKHYTPTRMVTSPWKAATRVPTVSATPSSGEYEFVRAASTQANTQNYSAKGAIHTIPAPNLSLSEKPIVVLEENNGPKSVSATSEKPKTYQATEKYPDPTILHLAAKIEQPIGFSKSSSLSQPDFQSLVRNGASLQVASELGLPAISLPQNSIQSVQAPVVTQQSIPQQHFGQHVSQQHFFPQQSIVPQQFTLHNFHTLPNAQEFMQAAPDGIVITPNALYQSDPEFLQKLQNQLLQRFPGVEFVPYAAGFEPASAQSQQGQIQNQILFQQPQNQYQNIDNQILQSQAQVHTIQQQQNQYQNYEPQPAQSQTQAHAINQLTQNQNQISFQPSSVAVQPQTQLPLTLLQNEQFTRQSPSSFVVAESQNLRNFVQRETQEGTIVTLVPQVAATNTTHHTTENLIEVTTQAHPQNITFELIAAESKQNPTTVKYITETSTEQKTTPIYHTTVSQSVNGANQGSQDNANVHVAQASQIVSNTVQPSQNNPNNQNIVNIGNVHVAQSAGNVVTDGFYSAINDVRVGAALAQVEKPQNPTTTQENITTTTINPTSTINAELKPYFVQKQDKDNQNKSITEIKPSMGVPFAKSQNSVNNVAYTLLRSDDKETKVAKDGSVYAGQIVEASVSEDQDFNKQKANLLTRRAPIRLAAVADNKNTNTTTTTQRIPSRVTTVVKARIPPKSKLTFDDRTGEPVLRIYASYVDSPAQKEALTEKLKNNESKRKEIAPRKPDSFDSWKAATVKALAKPHGFEPSPDKVTQFGLKLRSRSDDYVPLFDDYED